jgi:hypothetical protein
MKNLQKKINKAKGIANLQNVAPLEGSVRLHCHFV